MTSTGLDWTEKLTALTLLSGFIRHSALLRHELEEGREPGQAQSQSEREYGAALHLVVSTERFPHTSAMLASEALGGDSTRGDEPDQDFTDGLELVLDGLAARIAATSRTSSR